MRKSYGFCYFVSSHILSWTVSNVSNVRGKTAYNGVCGLAAELIEFFPPEGMPPASWNI